MLGPVTMSKDIPLGTVLHLVGLIATAVMFWMALSGRLDVLQANLTDQGRRIEEIKRDVDKLDDRVRDIGKASSLEFDTQL